MRLLVWSAQIRDWVLVTPRNFACLLVSTILPPIRTKNSYGFGPIWWRPQILSSQQIFQNCWTSCMSEYGLYTIISIQGYARTRSANPLDVKQHDTEKYGRDHTALWDSHVQSVSLRLSNFHCHPSEFVHSARDAQSLHLVKGLGELKFVETPLKSKKVATFVWPWPPVRALWHVQKVSCSCGQLQEGQGSAVVKV